jgi:uncharacterized protein YdaU (DUF1376 family)
MVRLMTLEQRGAYHEMLCVSWQIGPLPDDHALLSRLLGIDIETFERVWVYPLSVCWKKTKLGMVNERLEKERKWAEARQEKARKAGLASALARANQPEEELIPTGGGTPDEETLAPSANSKETNQIQIQNQIHNTESEEEKTAVASQPARLDAVFWEPKPKWQEGHESLQTAEFIVVIELRAELRKDFPRLDLEAEISKLKQYALANPSWSRRKKSWRKTLTNWLNRADERFDDARFKAGQARASPKEPKMYESLRRLSKEGGQQIGDG